MKHSNKATDFKSSYVAPWMIFLSEKMTTQFLTLSSEYEQTDIEQYETINDLDW